MNIKSSIEDLTRIGTIIYDSDTNDNRRGILILIVIVVVWKEDNDERYSR
jgi:hypothetical protein